MEPKLSYNRKSSANQPHEIAAVGLFEHKVADDGPGLLETAQQPSDTSADRRSSPAPTTSRDQADDATAPSLGLDSQESFSVGDSLSYALAVEIECCVG